MQTRSASARQIARDAARELETAGVPEPEAAAEVLLSELLGTGRAELALYREPLTEQQVATYGAWILRRKNREPVQRILGYTYFRNLKLRLSKETLIPRADTEGVVDAALGRIDLRGGACRVLDLGTGSGAIAISVAQERPRCEVHASDVSDDVLAVARRNAGDAGVDVRFHPADVASGLEHLVGRLDLLVSNPPYIATGVLPDLAPEVRDWDPRAALNGGPDGLAFYRRIFADALALLRCGADVVLEVGDGQAEKVPELGRGAGFVPLYVHPDLTGSPRAAVLRWEGN